MNSTTSKGAGGEQAGKRMTLSQIVERLLERGGSEHSSVELGRTAKGETTIGVTVRTSPDGDVQTIEEAVELAEQLYDRLRDRYPMSDQAAGAPAAARAS